MIIEPIEGEEFHPERWEYIAVRQVQVPGLPDLRYRMLEDAEREVPHLLPTYSMSHISIHFMFRSSHWLRSVIYDVGPPQEGHVDYFTPPNKGHRYQQWTLADAERMIRYLFSIGRIGYDHRVMALQLVAWTGRGHGLIHDIRGYDHG